MFRSDTACIHFRISSICATETRYVGCSLFWLGLTTPHNDRQQDRLLVSVCVGGYQTSYPLLLTTRVLLGVLACGGRRVACGVFSCTHTPNRTCLARCRGNFLDSRHAHAHTHLTSAAAQQQIPSPRFTTSSLPLAFAWINMRGLIIVVCAMVASMGRGFIVAPGLKGLSSSPRLATTSVPRSLPSSALLMSSAVEVEDEVAEKIVNIRPKAMDHLQELRKSQGAEGDIFLRMGVRSGGCSGLSYIMDLVKKDEITEDDMVEEYDGFKCVIDPKSVLYLFGLELDFSDALIGGGFQFQNPNAESSCGCGKSFGV